MLGEQVFQALSRIERPRGEVLLLENLRLLGCKGTTGTQASFLDLFNGDHAKVRDLERRIAEKLGLPRVFPVTGQTYSRKADAAVLDTLSGVSQSCAKLATDLRLLQHEGELLEPFESEQIGSSAFHFERSGHSGVGVEIKPAIRKAVRRDVEHTHHQRALAER